METAIVTTATIQINPTVDPAYESVKKEIELYAKCINEAVIDSPEKVQSITADVNLGAKLGKQVEKLRLAYKEDITKYGKQIDAAFKPLSTPIEEARKVAAQKIKAFNDEQREIQRKIDEENARKAREAAEMQSLIDAENERIKKEADPDTGETLEDLISPEPEPEYIPPAPVIEKASTDFGSATEKMVPKWKLADFSKVDDAYKVLNEKAINALVKAGVKQINGIEVWEEPEIKFRSK